MQEQFIPYEQALELKELGFNEKCFKSYRQQIKHEWYDMRSSENIIFNEDEKIILSDGKIDSHEKCLCNAPLWQQAFDWFRKHKYSGEVYYFESVDFGKWHFDIEPLTLDEERYTISGKEGFKTYEEARLECLKKLIEIIKNEQNKD